MIRKRQGIVHDFDLNVSQTYLLECVDKQIVGQWDKLLDWSMVPLYVFTYIFVYIYIYRDTYRRWTKYSNPFYPVQPPRPQSSMLM